MRERGQSHLAGLSLGILACQSRQGPPGPHFQQDRVGHFPKLLCGPEEPHRLAQMRCPVVWIHCFSGRQPVIGNGRKNANRWRVQFCLCYRSLEHRYDGIHHPRMKCMGCVQRLDNYIVRLQTPNEIFRRTVRAGDYTGCRTIHSSQIKLRALKVRENATLAKPHREHCPPGKISHQFAAKCDQPQSLFKGKDTSRTRGRELTDTVPDHAGRFDSPVPPLPYQRILNGENCWLR